MEGNDEEGSGGSCFSVPADVNDIARWHLNVLQKDRSLLLQLSHGVSFICIPRSGPKLSLTVGVMRALYLPRRREPFVDVVTLSGSDKGPMLGEWCISLSASEGHELLSFN